jgi:hypothetical protein
MKVRMLVSALGTFTAAQGTIATRAVVRGQVIEVDDASAARYVKSGMAEYKLHGPLGTYKPGG